MAQDVKNSLDVEPKFIFGLTNNVSGNCLFLNDNEIVYPASGLIVVYNVTNHSQKFIKLLDPRRIVTAMDLNTTKYLPTRNPVFFKALSTTPPLARNSFFFILILTRFNCNICTRHNNNRVNNF